MATLTLDIVTTTRGMARGFARANGIMAKFAAASKLAFAGAIAGGVSFGKHVADLSQQIDRNLVAGTGATGDALNALRDSVNAVGRNVPHSLDQVATAVADVNTRFKLTGSDLEGLTTTFLRFEQITGTDVTAAVEGLSGALTKMGESLDIGTATEALNDFLYISQATGIEISKLIGDVGEYGDNFKTLGFDIEETTALIGRLDEATISVSRLGPALNKFGRDAASLGRDPRAAFQQLIEQMEQVSTRAERLEIALPAVGAEGGQRLVSAVEAGIITSRFVAGTETAPGTTGDLLGDRTGTIADQAVEVETLGEKWSKIGNRITIAAMPAVAALIDALEGYFNIFDESGLAAVVHQVISDIRSADGALGLLRDALAVKAAFKFAKAIAGMVLSFKKMAAAAKVMGLAVKGAVVAAGPLALGFAAVTAAAVAIYLYWDEIVGLLKRVDRWLTENFEHWSKIKAAAMAIGGAVKTVAKWIASAAQALGGWLSQTVDGERRWKRLLEFAMKLSPIYWAIRGAVWAISTAAGPVWTTMKAIGSAAQSVWSWLNKAWHMLSTLSNRLNNAVSAAFRKIIGLAGDIWDEFAPEPLKRLVRIVGAAFESLGDTIRSAVGNALGFIWDQIKATFGWLLSKLGISNPFGSADSDIGSAAGATAGASGSGSRSGSDSDEPPARRGLRYDPGLRYLESYGGVPGRSAAVGAGRARSQQQPGGGMTVNINMPAGTSPADVARNLAEAQRRGYRVRGFALTGTA